MIWANMSVRMGGLRLRHGHTSSPQRSLSSPAIAPYNFVLQRTHNSGAALAIERR